VIEVCRTARSRGIEKRPPVTAFVAGKRRKNFAGLKAGDKVKLQLTPYDLSVGRILVETKTI
jgi:translation initiation factor IF-1